MSVIITTFNEEWNIADCIESVLWADEIFMVDSYSTDKTMEIARQYPIVSRRREYFGSAAQKNWSMDQVENDWVLILDADERVTSKLAPIDECLDDKALLAGDGEVVSEIYRKRVMKRGGRPDTWGWQKAYKFSS